MNEQLRAGTSRFTGSWPMCAQSFVLLCYLTVQILCYTQLNTRLNESLTRLDNLEFLLNGVLSMSAHDENRLRSNENQHGTTKQAAINITPTRYERTRRSDVEARLSELQRRIDKLQERAHFVPSRNTTSARPQRPPGRDGRDEQEGLNGRDERDGQDAGPCTPGTPGRAGATGPKGDRGDMGPPGTSRPKTERVIIKEHKRAPHHTPRPSRGKRSAPSRNEEAKGRAVYIRWGHRQCRTGTRSILIYEGRMAGSFRGGGTNYLCAPLKTQFNSFSSQAHHHTRLHGVVFGKVGRLFFKRDMIHSGVPCAVCRAPRASLLMIPALNYCPSAMWTREYHGFLMAQDSHRSDYSHTEYVCVDATAQRVQFSNTTRVQAKAFLTPVKSRCTALPCPPYRDDLELTCVVCTS